MRRDDLASRTVAELLGDYSDILTELIARGITRSRSSPVGDLAEYLAVTAYGGTLPGQSNPGWDFIAADGRRIQVKGLAYDPARRGTRKFGGIRSWDVDCCLFVVMDSVTFDVVEARELAPEWVRSTARLTKQNGRQLTLTQMRGHGLDVTGRLQHAMEHIDDPQPDEEP